jgi:hypothetical protein
MGSSPHDIDGDHTIDIHSDEFPIPPSRLGKLLDPKNPALLKELGGLAGTYTFICTLQLREHHFCCGGERQGIGVVYVAKNR